MSGTTATTAREEIAELVANVERHRSDADLDAPHQASYVCVIHRSVDVLLTKIERQAAVIDELRAKVRALDERTTGSTRVK